MLTDNSAVTLGDRLIKRLSLLGRDVRLQLVELGPIALSHLPDLLRGVDGVIAPREWVDADFPSLDLFDDTWVCVADVNNAEVADELSLDDTSARGWVITLVGRAGLIPPQRELRRLGHTLRVEVSVANFACVPFLVAGSARIGIMPTELAHRLATAPGVRVLDRPWSTPSTAMAMWWHPQLDHDPGHAWFRKTLRGARPLALQ